MGVIAPIIKSFRWMFSIAPSASTISLAASIITGLFPGLQTWLLVLLFADVGRYLSGENTKQSIILMAVLFIASYALLEIVRLIGAVATDTALYERSVFQGRMNVAEKSAKLRLIDYENDKVLDLRQRAMDCLERDAVFQGFTNTIRFGSSIVAIVSTISVLAAYNVLFVIICMISMIPTLIMRIARGRQFHRVVLTQTKKSRRLAYLWTLFTDKTNVKEMRIMGYGDYASRLWENCRDRIYDEQWAERIKGSRSLIWCDALKAIGFAGSVFMAFWLVTSESLGIGVFSACISAFILLQSQLKNALIVLGEQSEFVGYITGYFGFLELPEEKEGSLEFQCMDMRIGMENVSFSYPGSNSLAVNEVTLTIEPGQKIAILGENGSGKTTLAKLLLGVYPCLRGEVHYNDILVSSFSKDSFYSQVSIVMQDYMTYDLSLRQNIGLSQISLLYDDERLLKTIHAIGLEDVLKSCNGLDGELGRDFGGIGLSGGQSQKLAIARAMFKESKFIVLDEPTSALDPITETEILSKFIEVAHRKTAIIISHRVGLCKMVDKIAVMKEGRLVEFGNHMDLMAQCGEYWRIYNAQAQWYV